MMLQSVWTAAALFGALYWLGYCRHQQGSWHRSLVKTASVGLLAFAGLLAGGPWLVVAGLVAGAVGDFSLTRPGGTAFKTGVIAFFCGHCAYILLFAEHADPAGLLSDPLRLGIAAGLLVALLSTEAWLAPRTGNLQWLLRAYGLMIVAMALTALAVPPDGSGPGPVLGASLFMLSDLLLGLSLFVFREGVRHRILALLNWPTYWLGQFFILIAALDLPNPV